jgi:hypothetical protein
MNIKCTWSLAIETGPKKIINDDVDLAYVFSPDEYLNLVQLKFGSDKALDLLKVIMHAKIDADYRRIKKFDLFMGTGMLLIDKDYALAL